MTFIVPRHPRGSCAQPAQLSQNRCGNDAAVITNFARHIGTISASRPP
jgi:hypothetical protein